jgi:hypothetical protein
MGQKRPLVSQNLRASDVSANQKDASASLLHPLVTCCRVMSMFRGMVVEAGTRGLAMDPNARARRNRRHLGESRAAGQQGQDSSDRKDSTDFHCNAPSS